MPLATHPGADPGDQPRPAARPRLSVVTLVLLSMPDFLLATMLLITFVVMIPLLPAISLVDQTSTRLASISAP